MGCTVLKKKTVSAHCIPRDLKQKLGGILFFSKFFQIGFKNDEIRIKTRLKWSMDPIGMDKDVAAARELTKSASDPRNIKYGQTQKEEPDMDEQEEQRSLAHHQV